MRLHPYNIAQKSEVMVEHFNSVTRHRIGGRAKAMVVTGSRLETVRYKQAFDAYIKAKEYHWIKTLVAFSGVVEDDKLPGTTYTEIGMNDGIKESEIPDKFASKDYQVLLVAEKYQTGFDQPLLHTMYSDLEKLYTFLRYLAPKLRKRRGGKQYNFDEEIRLEYYRLQKISEGAIGLKEGEAKPLDGPNEVGSGVSRDRIALSRLIDLINDRFGTEFTEADQLFFDQIIEAAMLDDELKQAADANPEDKFALLFGNLLQTLFAERMEQNEDIFARFMNEKEFQQLVGEWISKQLYQRLRGKQA